MHSASSSLHFLLFLPTSPLLSPPSPPLLSSLFAARKKKRYKQPRKSKWSTGVIKKTKKKKPPIPASSSSSSTSSRSNSESGPEEDGVVEMRVMNGSADPNSSTASESSDGEQSCPTASMNGYHHDLNGVAHIQNGVLMNGYHHPEPLGLQPAGSVPTGRLNLRPQTRTSKTPSNLQTMVNGVCLSKIGLYL